MGSENGEEDERPSHSVQVSAFNIDKYEVSYAQYDTCVKKGVCSPPHYDDLRCIIWTSSGPRKVAVPKKYRSFEYPVVCVSWQQAKQYCRYMGKRLPTEAEWEYAALAGSYSLYSWGNAAPSESMCTPSSLNRPQKSGSYPANRWGLYDMTGNVWEWVEDRYQKDYYREHSLKDPAGPSVGRYRVIRGGGWYSEPAQLRIKNRQLFIPEYGEASTGIRCAK